MKINQVIKISLNSEVYQTLPIMVRMGSGDIKFTTTGAGAVGDAYQIVMRAIKQY